MQVTWSHQSCFCCRSEVHKEVTDKTAKAKLTLFDDDAEELFLLPSSDVLEMKKRKEKGISQTCDYSFFTTYFLLFSFTHYFLFCCSLSEISCHFSFDSIHKNYNTSSSHMKLNL